MILTRLYLNPLQRDVQRCLSDSQRLHARLLSAFDPDLPQPARPQLSLLYRLEVSEAEGLVCLTVQASHEVRSERLPANFLDPRFDGPNPASTALEPLLDRVIDGHRFRFRLLANVTRNIDTKTLVPGVRRHGKRVPLRDAEKQATWLLRKGTQHGFAPLMDGDGEFSVSMQPAGQRYGQRQGERITHEGVRYDGLLEVKDAALLRAAVCSGIGPAKAYGYGLLSLAPT